MKKHVQICEKNRLSNSYDIQIGSELGAKMYFAEEFLQGLSDNGDAASIQLSLNISLAIYESNYVSLLR